MNRIILVGNGFDLAHGLKTSYASFINWYWDEWGHRLIKSNSNYEKDEFYEFILKDDSGYGSWYYYATTGWGQNGSPRGVLSSAKTDNSICTMKSHSKLFSNICEFLTGKNWVDIENEYYKQLTTTPIDAKKTNDDLDIIKNKLIQYLSTIENDISGEIINSNILKHMLEPLKKDDISLYGREHWIYMIQGRLRYSEDNVYDLVSSYYTKPHVIHYNCKAINDFIKKHSNINAKDINNNEIPDLFLLPNQTLVLNFNYTSTADIYLPKNDRVMINHIHGCLAKPDRIIFGYGDELDENYKTIVNKNDNEYLRNVKSIKYLETPNYRWLLEFIELEPYQIYIMGHSCGNSDRTLLNTLFEHKNCVSIKPFYYIKENGSDSYLELVQNISRNFTDMKLMRDKVVNKTFCETLS